MRVCTSCRSARVDRSFRKKARIIDGVSRVEYYSTCIGCRARHDRWRATVAEAFIKNQQPRSHKAIVREVGKRVTIRDYPRIPRVLNPKTYCAEAIRANTAMNAAMLEHEWTVGGDWRINWCVRHKVAARDT